MANHRSAEKRHRQNLKRRTRNRETKSAVKAEVKKVVQSIDGGNVENAKAGLSTAASKLAKAAVHGVLHKRNAARRISRLAKRVNKAA